MKKALPLNCLAAAALLLLAGCVSQQKYDAVQQKNDDLEQEYAQLNQSMTAEVNSQQMQISRLQNANPALVSAHGYGEAFPIAPNDTAAGKAKNRRVELTLQNTGS